MDYLWSPWRFQYLAGLKKPEGCIFCRMASHPTDDTGNLVVFRGVHNFVVLNLYPYTSGHLMVVPLRHLPDLTGTATEVVTELMELTRMAESKLREVYRPDGFNIGMNIGSSAGAGVAGHIHMHVVPRWMGDANFMTITGETRVLPEELPVTRERMNRAFMGL